MGGRERERDRQTDRGRLTHKDELQRQRDSAGEEWRRGRDRERQTEANRGRGIEGVGGGGGARIGRGGRLFIYLFFKDLKPCQPHRSPQGFSQVQISYKLNTTHDAHYTNVKHINIIPKLVPLV